MAKRRKNSKFDFNENIRLVHAAFKLLATDTLFITNYRPILDPKHYDQPELRWLVNAICKEFDRAHVAPGTRILKMMLDNEVRDPDQRALLHTFVAKMDEYKATDEEIDFVYDKFESFVQNRAARYFLRKAADLVEDGEVERAIASVNEASLYRLTDENFMVMIESAADYFKDFDLDKLAAKSVPIGIPAIDVKLQGGLRKGELGVWLAPTGYGKSMALVQCGAEAFRRGKLVVHFTFENSDIETRARYVHNLWEMDSDYLREQGPIASGFEDVYAALRKKYPKGRIFIKELIGSRTTMNDLDAILTRLVDREDREIGMIIVDYGDLMMPVVNGDSRYENMGSVFHELRDLALIHAAPLWTATQSNRRGLEAKTVRLEHTSDSMGKMMNADLVISIGLDGKDRDGTELTDAMVSSNIYTSTTRVLRILKLRRAANHGWWMKVEAIFAQSRFVEIEGESWDSEEDAAMQEVWEQAQQKKGKSRRRQAEGEQDAA